MPAPSAFLKNYPVVRSSDPAFVRDQLCSVFGANKVEPGRSSSGFLVEVNHLEIRDLGVAYCAYAVKYRSDTARLAS